MISIILVILVDLLREQGDSVADEQVRHVQSEWVVDAALAQSTVYGGVVDYRNVIESGNKRFCCIGFIYKNIVAKYNSIE